MAEAPTVTCAVVFHDAAPFLAQAIESVLSQTCADWELLLVDDGSRDSSAQLASSYCSRDDRLRLLTHADGANHGVSASRNLAVAQAKGRYLALLDADDLWLPNKLAEQVALLDDCPEAAMVFGASSVSNLDGSGLRIPPTGLPHNRLVAPPQLLLRCYPLGSARSASHSDLMVRTECVRAVGGYEELFRGLFEDQVLLAKIYLRHAVFVSERNWSVYRLHEAQCCERERSGYEEARGSYLAWLRSHVRGMPRPHPAVVRTLELAAALPRNAWRNRLRRFLNRSRPLS